MLTGYIKISVIHDVFNIELKLKSNIRIPGDKHHSTSVSEKFKVLYSACQLKRMTELQ